MLRVFSGDGDCRGVHQVLRSHCTEVKHMRNNKRHTIGVKTHLNKFHQAWLDRGFLEREQSASAPSPVIQTQRTAARVPLQRSRVTTRYRWGSLLVRVLSISFKAYPASSSPSSSPSSSSSFSSPPPPPSKSNYLLAPLPEFSTSFIAFTPYIFFKKLTDK